MSPGSNARPSPARLAKLTPPRLPAVLARPRLFRLLDRASKHAVVWITAPPGYGKTTLVASYLKARKLKTLWYQVDEGDADVATFFHYLGLAAQQVASRFRTPLPKLTPEYLPGLPTFTRNFFQELGRRLPTPAVLVLDNYQLVPSDSKLHDVVAYAIEALPPGITLVALSRVGPPASLARAQANRIMEVVAKEPLELTTAETRALMQLHGKAGKEPPNRTLLTHVQRKVGGWVAGVMLLLRHAMTHRGVTPLATGQPPEVLFDYLAREVLHHLPDQEQSFLMRSAWLPKMTAGMTARLTGYTRGGEVLARLARTHYFTEQRFEQEPMFEYHPLFREFLQAQAVKAIPPPELAQLQVDAGKILEEAGRFEDAAALYREAGHHGELGRLILAQVPTWLKQGRYETVVSWIGALPAQVSFENPWLLLWRGTALLPLNPANARPFLEHAYGLFERIGERAGLLLAWSGVVDSIWMEWKDLTQLDPWLDRLAELVPDHQSYPSPEIHSRVVATAFQAFLWRRMGYEDISRWTRQVEHIFSSLADPNQQSLLGVALANYYMWMGEIDQSGRIVEAVGAVAMRPDAPPFCRINYYGLEAMHARELADAGRVLHAVEKGLESSVQSGIPIFELVFEGFGSIGHLVANDIERAEYHLGKQLALLASGRPMTMVSGAPMVQGWIAFLRGNLDLAAVAIFEKGGHVLSGRDGMFPEVTFHYAAAQIRHACGARQAADSHLRRVGQLADLTRSARLRFMYLLGQAQFALDRHESEAAVMGLREAFPIGARHRLFDFHWWIPEAMARLCALALDHEIEPEYAKLLIQKRYLVPPSGSATDAWPWPIKIRTLGTFTLERDGKPIEFGRKTPKKPLELLKAIITLGGEAVPETILADHLWPDAEGDVAHEAFAKTLQRLRHLLGHEEALPLRDGKVSLNRQVCWVDALAFEYGLRSAPSNKANSAQKDWVPAYQKAVTLYRGPFLHKEDLAPWGEQCRQRHKLQYCRAITRLMAHYRQLNQREPLDRCLALVADVAPDLIPSFSQ